MIHLPRIRVRAYDVNYELVSSDLDIEFMVFPGGEPHVKIHEVYAYLDNINSLEIDSRPTNTDEFFLTILLVDALRRELPYWKINSLYMPYFPGARQDRGAPLTAKVYADMINALNIPQVVIVDPHSDVITALIDNVKVISINNRLLDINKYDYLVSPDAGATKKVFDAAQLLGDLPIIQCYKHRDMVTGQLSSFSVQDFGFFDDVSPDSRILVVDDICDGGGTFIGISSVLQETFGALNNLDLFVTHGIFSKGTNDLLKHFNKIYSTDSFLDENTLSSMTVHCVKI